MDILGTYSRKNQGERQAKIGFLNDCNRYIKENFELERTNMGN